MKINNHLIKPNSPTFIVAEISANHLGKIENAFKLIEKAKEAGANAVKIQTYTPDTITINCDNEYFQIKHNTLWDGKTLYDLYKEAYTPWEWQPKLKELADKIGITLFSSPFDKTAVDFLETINIPAYKIASFEITDIPLIKYVASKNKPIIISTGIASLKDISKAIEACKKEKNNQIALLKCTSAYPAPLQEVNLKTIPNMIETFDCPIGLSDHTTGTSIAIASVALGAKIIEKHFTLDRKLGGPDAEFSLEPKEFQQMVTSIREVEQALGTISYDISPEIKKNTIFARSLFVVEEIKKGEYLTENNIRSIRPGYGMHPTDYPQVIGRKAKVNIKIGTPLQWDLIE